MQNDKHTASFFTTYLQGQLGKVVKSPSVQGLFGAVAVCVHRGLDLFAQGHVEARVAKDWHGARGRHKRGHHGCDLLGARHCGGGGRLWQRLSICPPCRSSWMYSFLDLLRLGGGAAPSGGGAAPSTGSSLTSTPSPCFLAERRRVAVGAGVTGASARLLRVGRGVVLLAGAFSTA